MFIKIKNVKKIGINEASYIYKVLCRHRNKIKKKEIISNKNNKLLFLTALFERDIFAFETCNLQTAYLIGRLNFELSNELKSCFSSSQYYSYKFGIYRFLKPRNLSFFFFFKTIYIALKWILLFSLSIVDFVLIIIYALFNITWRKFLNISLQSNKKNLSINNLYTIFYWIKKGRSSATYYYPEFFLKKSKLALIIEFANCRFISKGIISASNQKYFITAIDLLDYKKLFFAIRDLLKIYHMDIRKVKDFNYSDFVLNFFNIRTLNRRLFALLSFHAIPNLVQEKSLERIFIWSENQFCQRTINLSLYQYLEENPRKKVLVSSFIGSFYSNNYCPHRKPDLIEMKNGLWGTNNFVVQDKASYKELDLALSDLDVDYKLTIAENGLKRFKDLNIINNDLKTFPKRRFIYLTDGNPKEIYLVLLRFFNHREFNYLKNKETSLSIRLHPLIGINKAKFYIEKFKKKYSFPNLKINFIDPKKESIEESMLNSEFCIFGHSSYINRSIYLRCKVIAIKISYLYSPPIQKEYINSPNLKII
tara:strand:+ start:2627 stop:4231 length:1605 start_codon:yes stop_codon:yes gene_type:complete